MSIQKQRSVSPFGTKRNKNVITKPPLAAQGMVGGANMIEERLGWLLSTPDPNGSDSTVSKIYNIVPLANQKGRFLDIDAATTFVLNYASTDFPPAIHIRCKELDGMLDKDDDPTGIIATLTPSMISSNSNSGIIGYNIIYRVQNATVWDISHINVLTFSLRMNGDIADLELPLEQKLYFEGKIVRVTM